MSYSYIGILSISGSNKAERDQAYRDLFDYFDDDNQSEEYTPTPQSVCGHPLPATVYEIVFSVIGSTFEEELLEYSKKLPSLSFLYEVLSTERDVIMSYLCMNGKEYVNETDDLRKFVRSELSLMKSYLGLSEDDEVPEDPDDLDAFIEDNEIKIMRYYTNYIFYEVSPPPSKKAVEIYRTISPRI